MVKRKIIQIATAQYTNNSGFFTTALCDDGTVWELSGGSDGALKDGEWELLPPIPQFEVKHD